MWTGTIKQDGLEVASAQASNKNSLISTILNYAFQYSEEEFEKMVVTIKFKQETKR